MGAAGIKSDKETDEVILKRGVSMEKATRAQQKRSHDGLSHPNQDTIIINML